jgi:zinc transport system substrate-binding protein
VSTLLVAAFGPFLVACPSPSSANTGGKVEVVASFYPLAEAAERVGGDRVAVTNLTAPGVEPHDLELTPGQIESISSAQLVLYLGGGFQPAVEDALNDAAGKTLDVSSGLRTLAVPPGESEASLTADPHVWLDPELFSQVVRKVEGALAEADPPHAGAFGKNARAYEEQLSALNADYRAGLSSCDRNVIVTSHAAFGYLSRRYGLVQEPIAGLSPEAEPNPQHLADLKAMVERDGVTTIFAEDLVSPKVAQTLASETGVTTAVLNPLESLTPSELDAGENYVSVMRQNLSLLRKALGCS